MQQSESTPTGPGSPHQGAAAVHTELKQQLQNLQCSLAALIWHAGPKRRRQAIASEHSCQDQQDSTQSAAAVHAELKQ